MKVCRLPRGWRSFETIIWPENIPASWLTSRNVARRIKRRQLFIARWIEPRWIRILQQRSKTKRIQLTSVWKGRSGSGNNGIINKLTRRSKEEGEKRMASENGGNDRRRVLMMGGIGWKGNKKTVRLEQNRCGLNVSERALDYDDRSYDFDNLLSRYQLLRT